MKFAHDDVKRAIEFWPAGASSLRKEGWHHQDWFREATTQHCAFTRWSTDPAFSAQEYRESKDALIQKVSIRSIANRDVLAPEGISLSASWRPAGRWGVDLYRSVGDVGAQTLITFRPRGVAGEDLQFYPGLTRWEHRGTITADGVNYHFHLKTDPEDSDDHGAPGLSADRLKTWYKSPESLRDAGLAMLDHLEAQAREKIPAGQAHFNTVTRTEGGTASDDPPRRFDDLVKVRVDKQVMDDALALALKDIAARRKQLEENYKAMHTALVNVFPVEALVFEKQK